MNEPRPPPPGSPLFPPREIAPDEFVVSIGVIIGTVKLLMLLFYIVKVCKIEYANRKERHRQMLKKSFTLGENVKSSYVSFDEDRYGTENPTVDTMPTALRVASLSPTTQASFMNPSMMQNNNSSYFMILGEQFEMSGLRPFRIDERQLRAIEQIAKGAYGEVWRGVYQGKTVAIKTLISTESQTLEHVQVFVNEIRLMVELQHPCICQVIGASWMNSGDIKMVLEFMERGDLKKYLASTIPSICGWDDKFLFALDIIEGLVFIHSRNIIHRDLKSRNVLLYDTDASHAMNRIGAKLTDFGLSRYVENDNQSMSCGVGTFRWMAPEVFLGTHYTTAADIYSFGMILNEMDSHQVPFWDERTPDGQLINEIGIGDKVRRGLLQPKFSTSCPVWIETLAMQCVALDPEARPTAQDVLMTLRKYLDSSLFD